MKRFLTMALSLLFLELILVSCSFQASLSGDKPANAIKIGDYLQMGSYYDEAILWRCIDIDENGPLLLSDKILCLKPFDATGNHLYSDGSPQTSPEDYRTIYGSNLWETSNLRAWLNSTATAGNVVWLDNCPPTEETVFLGYNDYADEKGFLADGNFTENERAAISSVTQKALLNYVDVSKLMTGGTSSLDYNTSFESVVQNYDTAYYQDVTDKMFLLDVKQFHQLWQKGGILGEDYYIGYPTQTAVNESEYKNSTLVPEKYWFYWLRSPNGYGNRSASVRYVLADGGVYGNSACSGCIYGVGVRPAFYLTPDTVDFESAIGSADSPYHLIG